MRAAEDDLLLDPERLATDGARVIRISALLGLLLASLPLHGRELWGWTRYLTSEDAVSVH